MPWHPGPSSVRALSGRSAPGTRMRRFSSAAPRALTNDGQSGHIGEGDLATAPAVPPKETRGPFAQVTALRVSRKTTDAISLENPRSIPPPGVFGVPGVTPSDNPPRAR